MPYLIDGYNLLWAIKKNDEHFEPVEDADMCEMLDRFLRQIGDTGEVVFDGVGPPDKGPFKGLPQLRVLFSGVGVEADTVIEDKLAASLSPKKLQVVSNDRRVRSASQKSKAVTWSSETFWQRVESQLNRKRPAPEPPGKRAGINDTETKAWLQMFDLEQ